VVSAADPLQVTSKLKTKLSTGIDELPDMIVKQCIQTIKKPLTFIFNLSLRSGIFPNQMKTAKVRPLFQKGQKQKNIANYRRISILSVFFKILETLMYNRVANFLNKFNLISNAQNGFRKINLHLQQFKLLFRIQNALDDKQLAFGIFLDLSRTCKVGVIWTERNITRVDEVVYR
jgi:hypothetical protein